MKGALDANSVTLKKMNNPRLSPILAAVTLVAALAACQSSTEPQRVIMPTALTCPACATVTVTRVIDGDTLDTAQGRIRLFGIDAPERGERCFREATERLSELAGDLIRIESGPRAIGAFGRQLYYVYTMAGHNVEAILIREGLGRAWTRDGQHRSYLMKLEDTAREQGVGCLWGAG